MATQLEVTTDERLLPLTVVFDDLAPGALRVVSVISATPMHVSDIETLPADSFNPRDITRRLPQVEVREAVLRVAEGSVTP